MLIKRNKNKKSQETSVEKSEKVEKAQLHHEEYDENLFDEEVDFSKIDFAQREERRKGERRRGYRRIDERNLVSRAQEEANVIRKQAYEIGYNDALSKAKDDLENFKKALSVFFEAKKQTYEDISLDVLQIALEIAKKVIKTEITQNREVILSMIEEVLEGVSKEENKVTLCVSEQDYEFVKEQLEKIAQKSNIDAKISVVIDETIESSGVIVKTSNGIIDASINSQLKIIEEAFKLI